MTLAPSPARYSTGAIILHWLLALLLAGEIALGFSVPHGVEGFGLMQLHKSIGITILLLTLVRIGWRLTHARPAPLEAGLGGKLASAVHFAFYALMLAVPLTGWVIVSTAPINVPTLLFGTVPWPHLPLPDMLSEPAEEVHELLAFAGLALFVLHVAGALRHHFITRDGLLARMAPHGSAGFALALMLAVIALGLGVRFTLGGEDDHEHEREESTAAAPIAGETAPAPLPSDTATPTAEETEAALEDAAATDAPQGPPPAWNIRPGGALRFAIDNDGTALNGSFARWSGQIAMDPEHPETAAITIRIELASASLGDATQDEMLSGSAFFGSAANPTATWRATSVRRISGNRYEADGQLNLKGVTRAQRISFTLAGTGARRSVSGNASVDRNAFGVGTGPEAEGLAGTVNVSFAFDAAQQ